MYDAGCIRRGEAAVVAALIDHHVEQGHDRADGHAQDRAGGAHGQGHRVLRRIGAQDKHCDHEAGDDLEQDLQHLVHGGGEHVAVALAVAAISRNHAHQQDRGRHGAHAGRGVRVFQIDGGEPVWEEEQHRRKDQPKQCKAHERDAESLLLQADVTASVSLGHKARERDRQARRRQREENIIDVVCACEHGIALVAEDIPERYLVNEAQKLHDDDADCQDRGAVQIVLALLFCHAFPPTETTLDHMNSYYIREEAEKQAKRAHAARCGASRSVVS